MSRWPVQNTAHQPYPTFSHRKSFLKEQHNHNYRESYQSKSITEMRPMYRPYPNGHKLKLNGQEHYPNFHSTAYQGEEQNFETQEEDRTPDTPIESPQRIQENFSDGCSSSEKIIGISESSSDEFFDWTARVQTSTSDHVSIDFDDFLFEQDDSWAALQDKEDSYSEGHNSKEVSVYG